MGKMISEKALVVLSQYFLTVILGFKACLLYKQKMFDFFRFCFNFIIKLL